jgi:hypothetical protein
MGPSRPIDPPEAIENTDERIRTRVGRARISPSPIVTASM